MMKFLKINKILILICCLTIMGRNVFSADGALKLYQKGKYEDAIRRYNRIIKNHPDWEEAHYGKGAALYKSNRVEEAVREFESAIPVKNPKQKSAVLYNMGNALYQSNRIDESLQFYKKALELNPKDMDAKYNYELAKAMLKQQNSQDKQQNGQNQQKKDQKDQQQNGQNKQEQQQKEQQKQNVQQQQTQMKNRKEKEKSQKEAAQILDALKENEKNLMQERMKTQYSGIKKEKDW
ncbi:MAG: hypothetical protein COT43_10625 [Candidatus Marinimicrobia bacterium CG08_land_8_20_14_0_20_45_22]|nr:MAG: hypothetical protein COT43_10625 [Candidatus Marinimicrobia bacterium CG08_land_8_20_14_0_20_45_22]